MIPKLHPLAKTAIELRRQIYRLECFEIASPNDFKESCADAVLLQLRGVRNIIPKQFLDQDLKEG